MNAVTDIARSIVTAKWKEVVIGVLTLLLAASLTMVGSGLYSGFSKLQRIPEPDNIATVPMVNQRFKDEDQKIDTANGTDHESLVRIESKLDRLILSMATHRRIDLDSAPATRTLPQDRSVQVSSK